MARKYYRAMGTEVRRDFHDGHGKGMQLIATCPTADLAGKTAAKLNAADDYEYALHVISESGRASSEYAIKTIKEVNDKKPNHH